jgi:hypothetical protein
MQGLAKDVFVIRSTGFRTFVDPKGDLHHVTRNCRMAKIMLLNPFSEAARARAQSIPDPHVTPETFQEQIKKSIAFLKGLKAVKKEVKLKLYRETTSVSSIIKRARISSGCRNMSLNTTSISTAFISLFTNTL